MPRLHRMLEHVVGHAVALRDSFRRVERPVDTEIDTALAVFLFRLRQGGEAALHDRPREAIVVPVMPSNLSETNVNAMRSVR